MTKELEILMDIARSASKIITDDFVVEAKGNKGDLVTTYDFAVEKHIIAALNAQFPDFDIVSEELNTNNALTENCFTIDPIDGTIRVHEIVSYLLSQGCTKTRY